MPMRRNTPPALSQAELADMLKREERRADRPERVPVSRYFAESIGVGVGVAALVGAGLWMTQAPGDVLGNATATAGLLALGAGLVRRFWQPTDREGYIARLRQFQRAALAHEKRLHAAFQAIEQLEAQMAAERKTWEAALAELRQENRTLNAELNRYREERRTPNFVTRNNVEAQPDAAKILEHWFATLRTDDKGRVRGDWWSRPKSEAAGWGRSRQPAAAELLKNAGIVDMNSTVPYVLPQYKTLDAALFTLNKFCNQSASEPDVPRRQAVMSNEEYA